MILTDDMREDDLEHMPKTNKLLVDRGLIFEECLRDEFSLLSEQGNHPERPLLTQPPNYQQRATRGRIRPVARL
jgi:hypothetical protein